jgi:predicted MFS family arabinose efflux permease
VGAIALVAGAIVLPESADPEAHRVDTTGFCLGAAGISALAFAVILAENSGYGSPVVIALLCVFVAAVFAFHWWESRMVHPLLDVRFLRVPRFVSANVVAFAGSFATFAVFFFTVLYLEEVVGDTGFQIALIFLPMTALMVLASILGGFWTITAGLRWSMFGGCVLFGGGLLLTAVTINPNPSYLPLAAALSLTGIGVGATVVPATSAALSAIPPERSGMAASATNTSREIGAVTGVAVLGALVNAQLYANLTHSMNLLHVPRWIQPVVIKQVESGSAAGHGLLGKAVLGAAYGGFQHGLLLSLNLSAGLVLIAGILSFVILGRRE